jgi:hypothetical protein
VTRSALLASWLWIAAAGVGVVGGLVHYLLAATGPSTDPGIAAAARITAGLVLGCWVVLAIVWLVLLARMRSGKAWARHGLTVTALVGVGFDLVNLAGSIATVTAGFMQICLLAAAIVAAYRTPVPSGF